MEDIWERERSLACRPINALAWKIINYRKLYVICPHCCLPLFLGSVANGEIGKLQACPGAMFQQCGSPFVSGVPSSARTFRHSQIATFVFKDASPDGIGTGTSC